MRLSRTLLLLLLSWSVCAWAAPENAISSRDLDELIDAADSLYFAEDPRAAIPLYDLVLSSAGTRENYIYRAKALKGAADAMQDLSTITDSSAYLESALANYSEILRLIDYKHDARMWTRTKLMQSAAYARLACFRDREKNLQLAVRVLEDLIASGNLKMFDSFARSAYQDLGNALINLGELSLASDFLKKSATACEAAFLPVDPLSIDTDWEGLSTLIELYSQLSDLPDGRAYQKKSVELAFSLDSSAALLSPEHRSEFASTFSYVLLFVDDPAHARIHYERAELALQDAIDYFERHNQLESLLQALQHQSRIIERMGGSLSRGGRSIDATEPLYRVLSLSSPNKYPFEYYYSSLLLAHDFAARAFDGQTQLCADSAFFFAARAEQFFTRSTRPVIYGQICRVKATAYYALSRVSRQSEYLRKGIAVAREAIPRLLPQRDASDYLKLVLTLGSMYTSLSWSDDRIGNLHQALEWLDRGAEHARQLGWESTVRRFDGPRATALASLGTIENPVENLTQAIALFRSVLAQTDRENNRQDWVAAMGNLAVAHALLAEHIDTTANLRQALVCHDSALAAVDTARESLSYIKHLRQSAGVCRSLAEHENRATYLQMARERLTTARAIAAAQQSTVELESAALSLAETLIASYEPDSASTLLRDAVTFFAEGLGEREWPGRADVLFRMAEANYMLAEAVDSLRPAEQAIALADEALALLQSRHDPSQVGWALAIRGQSRLHAAKFVNPEANFTYAIEDLGPASDLACDTLQLPICHQLRFKLGLALNQFGVLAHSTAALDRSIAIYEDLAPRLSSEPDTLTYLTALNNEADGYLQIVKIEERPGYLDIAEKKFTVLSEMPELSSFPEIQALVSLNLKEVAALKSQQEPRH